MSAATNAGTRRDAVGAATDALAAAGCDTPRLDAELLIADALGIDRGCLVSDPDQSVPAHLARLIGERIRRRIAREPVAYILGRKGFRYLELTVDRRVLIPRPETELLVELCLELPARARVHDVGTGSGAVALAVKSERPDLSVSASDLSPEAVNVARANAVRLGIEVAIAVAPGVPAGSYDLVVANMPYVEDACAQLLEPEIARYEPPRALLGGPDGLDEIRALVGEAPSAMRLALEHAPEQATAVRCLLDDVQTRRDLAGRERVTVGRVR